MATDAGSIKLYDVSKRAKVDASTLPVSCSGAVFLFRGIMFLSRAVTGQNRAPPVVPLKEPNITKEVMVSLGMNLSF